MSEGASMLSPLAEVPDEEWRRLLDQGRRQGKLSQEDLAEVLRSIDLSADVITLVEAGLRAEGIELVVEEIDEAELVDDERLATIEGTVPSPANQPKGCRFSPRCPFADATCREQPPALRDLGGGHLAACWKAPVEAFAKVPA